MHRNIPKALFFPLVLFALHRALKRPTPAPARRSLVPWAPWIPRAMKHK
jgi:hypothetical protein